MKDIDKRALGMKLSIQGGYVPTESLKSYFLGELEKQRKIDIEKVYHALENVLPREMLDNIKKIMEE